MKPDAALTQFRELYRETFFERGAHAGGAARAFAEQWRDLPNRDEYQKIATFDFARFAPLGATAQFADIAARLEPALARVPSVAVVSARAGEGRSSVAIQLARDQAVRGGRRVLLVDSDMVRPTLRALLGPLPSVRGYSEYVEGRCALHEAAVLSRTDRFMVLPLTRAMGKAQRNGSHLESFTRTLAESVDLIVFDTPPAREAMRPLMALVRNVAATILVRSPRTPDAEFARLVGRCQATQTPILGYLANAVTA